MPDSLIAVRFARRGVAGLIAWPSAEPVFDAALLSAHRPPETWTRASRSGDRHHTRRTEAVPDPRPGRRSRQVPRPREDWIAIAVPAIIDEQTFEAAGRVSRDNSQWSPRRAEPGGVLGGVLVDRVAAW